MEENTTPPSSEIADPKTSSNKTPIFIAIAVVAGLFLLGGVLFVNRQTKTSPESASTSQPVKPVEVVSEGTPAGAIVETVVVEKSDSGFSPETIKVKKGTMVKFVNKSKTSMWVTSAPHPAHTDYPEFDQKAKGDIFGFLFMKVGSWKYHNHSPFSPGGVVIVTE